MKKFYCVPSNFAGVGYKDGVKQCEYTCYPMAGEVVLENKGKTLVGPAMHNKTKGDVCYGVEYTERWIASFNTFAYVPKEISSFTIDVDSFWSWLKYPNELRNIIKDTFGIE